MATGWQRDRHPRRDVSDALGGPPGEGPRQTAAPLTVQVSDGEPAYLALAPDSVAAAARALGSAWRTLGVRRGDTVLICDYGTSPLVLFASWCFAPYLERGAADLLGAVPICNDGLPEFVPRALHVLRYLRPRVTIIDHSQLPLFLRRADEEGSTLAAWTELVVVSPDEVPVLAEEAASWSSRLGVPVRLILRSGPALFFAAECDHGALHADPRFYRLSVIEETGGQSRPAGEGTLRVVNRFLTGTAGEPHVAHVRVILEPAPCPCGRPGRPFRCVP